MSQYTDTCNNLDKTPSIGKLLASHSFLSSSEAKQINKLAHYLKKIGVTKGATVAIISNTRAEWLAADLAIISLGAVSVSVYQSLTPAEIAFILHDSNSSFVFVENQEQVNKLEQIAAKKWPIPAIEEREAREVQIKLKSVISFEAANSNSLSLVSLDSLEDAPTGSEIGFEPTVTRKDLASIVYTSGTTGPPKGVMQSHENHLANIRQVLRSGLMLDEGSIFLFLPLAHSFARLMAYITVFTPLNLIMPQIRDKKTCKIDLNGLAEDLRNSNAEIFPVVPRFLEKIRDKLLSESKKNGLAANLLKLTLKNAEKNYNSQSTKTKLLFSLLRPIRKKIIKKIFGDNYQFSVSGGAKLPSNVHIFFDALEIKIVQGYGLTETCVATNACRPSHNKIGSVGPALDNDIKIKILDDQEIAIKGPNVALGYLNRPNATAESWTADHWFLTGDLGHFDEDSFLYISGRKKEIIATSGGKKIAPLPIEEKILAETLFSQAVLVGEGRKYLSVILTLNQEEVYKLKGEKIESLNDEDLQHLVKLKIDQLNSTLASYESIKKVIIAKEEFSLENGLLTPSMKIKRKEVEKRYKEQLDLIYSENT